MPFLTNKQFVCLFNWQILVKKIRRFVLGKFVKTCHELDKRIRKEYKIDADLGPLMVAYKEAPVETARCQIDFERKIAGDLHQVNLDISVKPMDIKTQNSKMKLSKSNADKNNMDQLR